MRRFAAPAGGIANPTRVAALIQFWGGKRVDSPTRINQAIAFIGLQIDEISSYSSLQIDKSCFIISLQIDIAQMRGASDAKAKSMEPI
jgi:hypothetical protein